MMTEKDAIKLFKCLSDQSRLQILKSLAQEDMYVDRLAGRLGLTPATISFHLKKLEDAGAVTSRREQYYTVYSLCQSVFKTNILDIILAESDEAQKQKERDDAFRKKVISTFFEYGRLKAIPSQRKKERICLEEIAKAFEIGRPYEEKALNEIIQRYFDDYCTIRRDMIGEGIMTREGTIYTRIE